MVEGKSAPSREKRPARATHGRARDARTTPPPRPKNARWPLTVRLSSARASSFGPTGARASSPRPRGAAKCNAARRRGSRRAIRASRRRSPDVVVDARPRASARGEHARRSRARASSKRRFRVAARRVRNRAARLGDFLLAPRGSHPRIACRPGAPPMSSSTRDRAPRLAVGTRGDRAPARRASDASESPRGACGTPRASLFFFFRHLRHRRSNDTSTVSLAGVTDRCCTRSRRRARRLQREEHGHPPRVRARTERRP